MATLVYAAASRLCHAVVSEDEVKEYHRIFGCHLRLPGYRCTASVYYDLLTFFITKRFKKVVAARRSVAYFFISFPTGSRFVLETSSGHVTAAPEKRRSM